MTFDIDSHVVSFISQIVWENLKEKNLIKMNKMFGSVKSLFSWKSPKSIEMKQNTSSFLLIILLSTLEDVLLWKKMWISLLFFLFFNIVFV